MLLRDIFGRVYGGVHTSVLWQMQERVVDLGAVGAVGAQNGADNFAARGRKRTDTPFGTGLDVCFCVKSKSKRRPNFFCVISV